jgi:hypothetical protein
MTFQFCVTRISGRQNVNRFLCSSQAITGSCAFATGLFIVEYQAWDQNYSPANKLIHKSVLGAQMDVTDITMGMLHMKFLVVKQPSLSEVNVDHCYD